MWWVAAAGAFGVAIVLRRLEAIRVEGESMIPTLRAGDRLAIRPLRPGEPRPGQIVVARTPDREVIKRVTRAAAPDGAVWLEGDNAARSTDSRTTGSVRRADVVGVVVGRYAPLARARLF